MSSQPDRPDTAPVDDIRAALAPLIFVDMTGIAELLKISYHRVKILRSRSISDAHDRDYVPRSDALPPPLPMRYGPTKLPGAEHRAKDPVWLLDEIITWGQQTGRLSLDGRVQRAKPTGRPPKIRTTEDQAGSEESLLSV